MPNFKSHHVSINVCDLIKSQKFYHLLGFVECHNYCSEDRDVKIIHLLKDDFIIELFSYAFVNITKTVSNDLKHREFIGIDHFSLQTDDIETAYSMLSEYVIDDKGIQYGRTGIRFFFIGDPDGNRIEIVEDKRDLKTQVNKVE
jgi:glyoxylase I family protein